MLGCDATACQVLHQARSESGVGHFSKDILAQAFRVACANGHLGVVSMMLEQIEISDFDVNSGQSVAFCAACSYGHLSVVRALLGLSGEHEVDVHARNEEGFRSACGGGHVGIVLALLDLEGARAVDVHAASEWAFRDACSNGHLDVVTRLLKLSGDRAVDIHADNDGAFRDACGNGHLHVVRCLLSLTGDRAVDVHADDDGGFQAACESGHLDVVHELLQLTGDRAVDTHAWDEWAFRGACGNGHLHVVRCLLSLTGDRSVDVHAEDDGGFQTACESGHLDVVHELLQLTDEQAVPAAVLQSAAHEALLRNRTYICAEILQSGHATFGPDFVLRVLGDSSLQGASAELMVALDQCEPHIDRSLMQHVSTHALIQALSRVNEDAALMDDASACCIAPVVRAYSSICAALPASGLSAVGLVLQQHRKGVQGGDITQAHYLASAAKEMSRHIWCGFRAPPVLEVGHHRVYEMDSCPSGIQAALQCHGRKYMVLKRVKAKM